MHLIFTVQNTLLHFKSINRTHTFSTALFPYYWRIFFSVQLRDITVHPLKFKQIQTHSLFLSKTKTCKNINTQERAQSQVVTRQMEPQQQMVTKTKEV